MPGGRQLTQLASRFSSEIFISRGAQRAKSIMGVMMLAPVWA